MLRRLNSLAIKFIFSAAFLAAPIAHAQSSATFARGGTADSISMILFWIFMLLALLFLWLAGVAYARSFEGSEVVHSAHRRILYMVISVFLAILVRAIVLLMEG